MSKVIAIRSQDHFEQLIRSTKAVLVDFWAEWCGPCKVIKGPFEETAGKLSKEKIVSFASIDHDSHKGIVAKHNVTALPTIILFENGKEVQRVKGVDLNGFREMIAKITTIASTSSWTTSGPALPKGYYDITDSIDLQGVELLNADGDLASARILFSNDKPTGTSSSDNKGKGKEPASSKIDWVASDTDAQLMLFIPFQSIVKVHSLHITSFAARDEGDDDDDIPARPRHIEIYTNRSHNLGFDEAEDMSATQSVELSPDSWDSKTSIAVVETRFVKFQNVTSLVLFIVDANGDAEKTRIDRIRVIGETGEKRTMGKLQKVGEDEQ